MIKSVKYEWLHENFLAIESTVRRMLDKRARQARYHAFKYFLLSDCPHCRKVALNKMRLECPEKIAKDIDVRMLRREGKLHD